VARGVSFNDCNSGAHDTNSAIRVQRIGVGVRVLLLNGDGHRHLLLLLPHVQGARTL
jgi:hypothetical protein